MPDISSKKIYSQSAKLYWQTWIFALIWNTITWFAIIKGGHNILRAFAENPVFYFFALFPVIGIGIIISAIQQTLAWQKFGKTPLMLSPSPGQIGGNCSGFITLPISTKEAKQAVLSLSCIRRYIKRSSDGTNSTREQAIWQDRISLKPDTYGRKKCRIKFTFNPPANLPESELESTDYHLWRIQVRIPLPSIDYDRIFILPMQKVDEQELINLKQIKTQTSSFVDHRHSDNSLIPEITKTKAGTQFYYGYGRAKLMAIALIMFGLTLAFFGYYFFDAFLDFIPATGCLMSIFVGLIAVVFLLLGGFLVANSLTVEVDLTGIRKQQRIFGYTREQKIDVDNIVNISIEQNASSTSGTNTRVWYRLKLFTNDGHYTEVGDNLEGQSYAEEIRQQMITALGKTWNAATINTPEEKTKRPIPIWLRRMGKLQPYSLLIAFLYDLNKLFPEITDFIAKLLP